MTVFGFISKRQSSHGSISFPKIPAKTNPKDEKNMKPDQAGKADKQAYFNSQQRAAEKQAARDRDDQELKEGKISREDLQRRNSFFPEGWARDAEIASLGDWD